MPVGTIKTTFIPTDKGILVIYFAQYPDGESLETMIKMGMSEGLDKAFNQLENVLKK